MKERGHSCDSIHLGPEDKPVAENLIPLSFFLFQVVGSQARILYSDQKGRVSIAVAINRAISEGKIKVCLFCLDVLC